ncbi:MAG: EthD domain-containing protein [Dokdonella sp.]
MVKLIVAIKRRADLSVEAFQQHWRTRHAALVLACPASARYIRGYVQCLTIALAYAQGEPAFDGTAELWFDSDTDRARFFSDPDYLETVQPDEGRFADMTQTRFFLTEEHRVI